MKSLIFALFLALCLVTIYTPTVHSQGMNSTISCQDFNGTNCTACLEYSRTCYWCSSANLCLKVDFNGLISTTCPVTELFAGDCVLTGLYIIIIIVAAVLLVLGLLSCLCITLCVCCCWVRAKKRNHDDDKQRFNMGRINDSKEAKRKEREERRQVLQDKYF